MGYNFTAIEKKWQEYWLTNKTFAALDPADAGGMQKAYVLDMFPYPSGAGLHVGHPEGYTATDIVSRYLRMAGYNVLHPMGWDAFGLPAEQYAIKTNTHPRETTEKNIATFRKQIQMLGLSYDWDREVNTTDPSYFKWTQWIFLQIYNSYFDPAQNKAMPIAHLISELENGKYVIDLDGSLETPSGVFFNDLGTAPGQVAREWKSFTPDEQRDIIDGLRLAYTDEIPVNWCPGLGTVLANEEIIDGKSEVGGFPVEKRPLRQWLLRITAYADRLVDDLKLLDWPESLKEMQRNWIGKSVGAEVDFAIAGNEDEAVTVFTTRPDTLYGATYMVLAPEHPLVDSVCSDAQKSAVAAYRAEVAVKSERDRMADTKEKTGVFTGGYAINPVNHQQIPIYIADYVLMGYGTGAIMAVPAHDERDFAFAKKFDLPIVQVVERHTPSPSSPGERAGVRGGGQGQPVKQEALTPTLSREYTGEGAALERAMTADGLAINSGPLNGLATEVAKTKIIESLEASGDGLRSIKYKLRDWLFSRQRYWGEPFPIVLDQNGYSYAIDVNELPLKLPEMADFKPTGTPEPPLSKAAEWTRYAPAAGILGSSGKLTRETNTMPQWAGSCWYYLRYIDPKNPDRLVDPEKEKYWMPVDLYVGGVEHAVLHLLYARFWHKILFDLGHVSTPEPFARLVNQGLILGETEYTTFAADDTPVSVTELRDITEEGTSSGPKMFGVHKASGQKLYGERVGEDQVLKKSEGFVLKGHPEIRVDARTFKMSKARGNVVNPDDVVKDYGADAFRLYEMYMGPLEAQKPWNTRDIVGMSRFLNSVWRNLVGDEEANKTVSITNDSVGESIDRIMHRTIKKVAEDVLALRFNVAIAELIKLNNEITGMSAVPRTLAENFVLMLAPFAPHAAEEIWLRLGHHKSLARRPWPTFDPAKLIDSTIELPVQVNGKLRDKIAVAADADESTILKAALAAERVQPWLAGKTIRKKLYVPKKLVNIVVSD